MATVRLGKCVAAVGHLTPGFICRLCSDGCCRRGFNACQCAVVAAAASALPTSVEGDDDDFEAVNMEGVIGLALPTHLFCFAYTSRCRVLSGRGRKKSMMFSLIC